MTQQQKLDYVTLRAIRSGYDHIHLIEYAKSQKGHLKYLAIRGLLLSPDFAKAYWGEEEMKQYHGDMNEPNEVTTVSTPVWQYHIQQAVVDNVTDYYYENK